MEYGISFIHRYNFFRYNKAIQKSWTTGSGNIHKAEKDPIHIYWFFFLPPFSFLLSTTSWIIPIQDVVDFCFWLNSSPGILLVNMMVWFRICSMGRLVCGRMATSFAVFCIILELKFHVHIEKCNIWYEFCCLKNIG